MIINISLNSLFKQTPEVNADSRAILSGWLKTVNGTSFARVFEVQMEMVQVLLELESKVRVLDEDRKKVKVEIPGLKSQGRMDDVRACQKRVSEYEEEISALHWFRDCILLVGDTMAVHIVDVDAIKQFAGHPPPGFISKKEGLKAEIDAARSFYREGYFVLLNDLTHCLRVGDLTLRKGDETRTFEVKSEATAYFTKEAFRQISVPIMVHDYIKTDIMKVPVKEGDKVVLRKIGARLNSGVREDWHPRVAGKLCKELRGRRTAALNIGKKVYLAGRRRDADHLKAELQELTREGEWVVANVRRRVTQYPDVPPFTKWFKPDTTVEILAGDLIVLSAFAMADLAALLKQKGVTITWEPRNNDDLFPITFSSPQFRYTNLGDWQRLKLLYSFLSIESFVEICSFLMSPEAMTKMEEMMREEKPPR